MHNANDSQYLARDRKKVNRVFPVRECPHFRIEIASRRAYLWHLRERLTSFYQRYKLSPPATAADQAARYVSLAYALGPQPLLEAPDRSED